MTLLTVNQRQEIQSIIEATDCDDRTANLTRSDVGLFVYPGPAATTIFE